MAWRPHRVLLVLALVVGSWAVIAAFVVLIVAGGVGGRIAAAALVVVAISAIAVLRWRRR